jgi:hypothetical protein
MLTVDKQHGLLVFVFYIFSPGNPAGFTGGTAGTCSKLLKRSRFGPGDVIQCK